MLGTCRMVASGVVAAALVLGIMPAAHAGTDEAPLSKRGCDAFNDYFQVNFAIAFLTSFAEALEDLGTSDVRRAGTTSTTSTSAPEAGTTDTTGPPDLDQLRNVAFLVFSPKLEQSTGVLAKQAPKNLRPLFADQRDVYRDGVELLRDDVGLTDEQIEAIRDTDLTEEEPDALADDLGIDEADLEAAAAEFGEQADVLTAADANESQSRGFERLAVGCGSIPDSTLDCDVIVSADLRERLLGEGATVSSDDGTCTYAASGADDDEPVLAIDVYRSADAYDRILEQNDAAEELDDEGATLEGFLTFSRFKTCGRTLLSPGDDATIVVALCPPDDADVPVDDLTDVL